MKHIQVRCDQILGTWYNALSSTQGINLSHLRTISNYLWELWGQRNPVGPGKGKRHQLSREDGRTAQWFKDQPDLLASVLEHCLKLRPKCEDRLDGFLENKLGQSPNTGIANNGDMQSCRHAPISLLMTRK